ncbi:hypothetical protein BTA35_0203955 [Oceanospirillum linum]|uniref:Uncharacterized protein n=1 Tax=Oceanospirillum linum TaxID=966 RepID=A0A1T1HFL4_OCELI|nr:hypothetical protein BTA35_0203955 [Oceanospirillum linum]
MPHTEVWLFFEQAAFPAIGQNQGQAYFQEISIHSALSTASLSAQNTCYWPCAQAASLQDHRFPVSWRADYKHQKNPIV